MDFFDWNQLFDRVPPEWRATQGKGIRLALLDSGLNFEHLALQHLTQSGHKFWVTRPTGLLPDGNDEVMDTTGHGTGMASILVGQPEDEAQGMRGVAPQTELFILKVRRPALGYLAEDVLTALRQAVKLRVDIIVCGILPGEADLLSQGAIQAVFEDLETKHIMLFAALENTSNFVRMNELRFPCNQAGSIVTGSVAGVLPQLPLPTSVFHPRVEFLHSSATVTFATKEGGYKLPPVTSTCSTAVAALAGVAALAMAHWKAEEGDAYRRRSRAEVLAALRACFPIYRVVDVMNATKPQFFHLSDPEV